MKTPIGPDPIRELIGALMSERSLTVAEVARLALARPGGEPVTDDTLSNWLSGSNRITTTKAAAIAAGLGFQFRLEPLRPAAGEGDED